MTIRKVNEKMIDPSLVQKVNDHTALLAEKAKQTDLNSLASAKADKTLVDANYSTLDTKINSQASGSPKATYATLAALQSAFPTGNTNIYLVTADGKWYYWNGTAWTAGGTYQATAIQSNSVTPEKTTFLKFSKNLFNKDTAIPNNIVNQNDGNLNSNATYTASDYIPVSPSTQYTMARYDGSQRIAYYDSNKTFISGALASGATVTTPANCAFVRFSFTSTLDINKQQFEAGSTSTAYEAFNLVIANLKPTLGLNSVDTTNLKPLSVTKDKIGFPLATFQQTKNLFNKNTVITGYFVNQSNGQLALSVSYYVSDYISVSPSSQYSLFADPSLRIAYYDVNQTFISGALAPTVPVTTPANCVFVRISYPTTINRDLIQFEQGAVSTSYANYGFTSSDLLSATSKIINLPPKLYALVGQELNIYFDNIIEGRDIDYTFDVVCGKGQQFDYYWRLSPTLAESLPITINAYKDGGLVASATSTIIISASSVGNGITKKVIVIGDSTTDNGIAITKLNTNFSSDVMDISTIGTRGTSPNQHEGRSGWTANNYVSAASLGAITNSFWNPTTSTFDFSYYMSTFGLVVPDYVIINLGINDMFSYSDDVAANTEITNILARYNTVINSIKAYNANIKIGIAISIPPNYSQDAFAKDYGSGQNRTRYKRNNLLWANQLIATFKNREAENLYLIPIHTNLDTRYNMGTEQKQVNARNTTTYTSASANSGVHPADSGYWQIADVYWYFLKSFEV